MKPYALFAFEFDTDAGRGQADGGLNAGKYLELGVAPGYSADSAPALPFRSNSASASVTTTSSDGVDHTFGFFSIGGLVTVPLGGTTSLGAWNVHGGVEYQALGDTTKVDQRG